MKSLPVDHEAAQQLFDRVQERQNAVLLDVSLPPLERVSEIEYLGAYKERLGVLLVRLELAIHKLSQEFDEDSSEAHAKFRIVR